MKLIVGFAIVKLFSARLLDVASVVGTGDTTVVAELTATVLSIFVIVVIARSFAAVIPGVFPAGVLADVSVLDCEITLFAIIVSVTGLEIVVFALSKIAGTTVVNESMLTVLKVALGTDVLAGVILTTSLLAAANMSVLVSATIVAELGIFVVVGTSVFVAKGTWTVLVDTVPVSVVATVVMLAPVDTLTLSLGTLVLVPVSSVTDEEVCGP